VVPALSCEDELNGMEEHQDNPITSIYLSFIHWLGKRSGGSRYLGFSRVYGVLDMD